MIKNVYFIKPILLAMINTGIMMIAVFAVKNYLFVQIGFVEFFSLVIGGAAILLSLHIYMISFLITRCTNYFKM